MVNKQKQQASSPLPHSFLPITLYRPLACSRSQRVINPPPCPTLGSVVVGLANGRSWKWSGWKRKNKQGISSVLSFCLDVVFWGFLPQECCSRQSLFYSLFFVSKIMVSVYILPCMPCLLACKRVQSMRGSRRPTEDVSSIFAHFSVAGPASSLIIHTRKCPPALPSFTFISNRATDRGMEGLPCVMC